LAVGNGLLHIRQRNSRKKLLNFLKTFIIEVFVDMLHGKTPIIQEGSINKKLGWMYSVSTAEPL
jgi:hypothetical protein